MDDSAEAWETDWSLSDKKAPPKKGGQGLVRQVVRKSDNTPGALKVLHPKARDPLAARSRMRREADALATLNGEGTPKLLATNATNARWRDQNLDLYIVMEWVQGRTLGDHLKRQPLALDAALTIVAKLLDTIERCHQLGFFHRDLKPDNVILREGSSEAVVVDFGLASPNELGDRPSEFITPTDEEIGPRFLRLPEFAGGQNTDYPQSDITLLVGLLFYMLTGHTPGILRDAHNRMPHEAYADRLPQSLTADARWPRLKRVFDVGFQLPIELRFQSADELRQRLANLSPPKDDDQDKLIEEKFAELDAIRKSRGAVAAEARRKVMRAGSTAFLSTISKIVETRGFQLAGSGPDFDTTDWSDGLSFHLLPAGESSPSVSFDHRVRANESAVTAVTWMGNPAGGFAYYEGPIADVDGMIEAATKEAANLVPRLLDAMKNKLEERYNPSRLF